MSCVQVSSEFEDLPTTKPFRQLKAAIIADKSEDVASCLRRIPHNVDALTIEHRLTLIEMAILKRDTEILRILLDKEAEFQQKCLLDADPLVAACSSGYLEGVKLLIERGSDVGSCCLSGYPCLLAAAKNKHLAVVSYLLEQDPSNVNEVGRDGYSVIHHIALLNDSDTIFKLISTGADVNAQTWDGETPVYLATKHGCLESLEMLLEYGGDPNIKTEREDGGLKDDRALHEAVEQCNLTAVKLLLSFGADITTIRSDGLSPIDIALSLNPWRQDIVDALLDHVTVAQQVKNLALRCKRAEMEVDELQLELEEQIQQHNLAELEVKELQSQLENQKSRCSFAEQEQEKLQSKVQTSESLCQTATQTLLLFHSKVDDCLSCPITCEVMKDPVIAGDGHTYERAAIEQWLSTNRESPLTRQPLTSTSLIPNIALKGLLDANATVKD